MLEFREIIQWVGSSYLIKQNHTSEIDTTSSPETLRHYVYLSSHLCFSIYSLASNVKFNSHMTH